MIIHQKKCEVCGNTAIFINFQKGYKRICSRECLCKLPDFRKKLSNSLKNSEKVKKQQKIRAILGQQAFQNKLKIMSESELKAFYKKQKISRDMNIKEKYGVDNVMKIKEIAEKNHKKMRETNIKNGRWLNYDKIENDFEQYKKKVEYITERQDLSQLKNIEKRGHVSKKGKYHLDHMFSKKEGFINNIPPYIIGNVVNLEMIEAKKNLSKQEKCSINLDSLLKKFFGDF